MFSAKHSKSKNTAKSPGLDLGKEGEIAACKYLVSRGYAVLGANIFEKFGEVDVVARRPDKTLVFVEVKSLTINQEGFFPEDQMSGSKIMKLRRTCEFLANKYPELIDENKGWQIDSLCLTKSGKDFEIKHYENIV